MSGGKTRVEQPRDTAAEDALLHLQTLHYTHRETKQFFLMTVSEGATDAQIEDALWQGLKHRTDPASLQESLAGKEPEGTDTTEKGKQSAVQKKRTHDTSQAPTTQPASLSADALAAALGALPADDWFRTWAAGRTIMLRMTSKRVKEVVDKMSLSAGVRLSRSFWNDTRNGTEKEKRQFVLRQLAAMTSLCRITTLELRYCAITGPHSEWIAGGVLVQCGALVYLHLSGNDIGADGAVLQECWSSAER
jgi:hypothetical protein